jgi:hypothetical protein
MDSRRESNRKTEKIKGHNLYSSPNNPGVNKSRTDNMHGLYYT